MKDSPDGVVSSAVTETNSLSFPLTLSSSVSVFDSGFPEKESWIVLAMYVYIFGQELNHCLDDGSEVIKFLSLLLIRIFDQDTEPTRTDTKHFNTLHNPVSLSLPSFLLITSPPAPDSSFLLLSKNFPAARYTHVKHAINHETSQ